jgi:putative inorganic carbon (HCO3(-)) transporter
VEKPPVWIERGYLILFVLLPWSFEYSFGEWNLNLPGEPLIALQGLALAWQVARQPTVLNRVFTRSRLLKISLAWVCWMAVCAAVSTIPLVSWKYWVVETGHWWVFAVGLSLFPDIIRRGIAHFAVSMSGMVAYTLIHHAFYHFRADQALLAPMPFFPENTLYGAVLAMVVFLSAATCFQQPNRFRKVLFGLLFSIGLFFSFSQAAWVSVLVAGAVGTLVYYREKWRTLIPGFILLVLLSCFFRQPIQQALAQDVSFQERLNRYSCALRMSADRMWTGFGPGTFQFQYLPYQRPEQMTRISIRQPIPGHTPDTYGRGGGAHSEYFQALADMGLAGLTLYVLLAFVVLASGIQCVTRGKTREGRIFILLLTLGLMTFFLHGLLNNLLHDGRIAALVWAAAVGSSSRQC